MTRDRPGTGTFTYQEQVKTITNEVIEKVLGSHTLFDGERVGGWSDQVGANAAAALVAQCGAQERTYRFAVTTTIVQRNGTGLSTSSAAVWDKATDFNVTVLWENQALTCVVVVFALAV
ncbi:hypothetical protein VYU27_007447 [Nannochloropsis oceanica]